MKDILDQVYWHNTLAAWLTAAGGVALAFLLIRLVGLGLLNRLRRFSLRTSTDLDDFFAELIAKALVPILYAGSVYMALSMLVLPARVDNVLHVAWLVVLSFYVLRAISASFRKFVFSFLSKRNGGQEKQKQAGGLIVIVNVVIWLLGIIFLIDNLGYNVTTLVAGLGIGGIAIALAAQTILGDLFSYFVIFFDRPFEIGDFVTIDDKAGVIEYIGVKTTRLRTLGGEQLVCSNTDLTNARLHNYKRLESRRVVFKLGVAYQTSHALLQQIPGIVRAIIEGRDMVRFDRAHFSKYGDFSLDFEFVYYVDTQDYNTYMDIHQAVLLDVFATFENKGIEFAYPTQTIFLQGQAAEAVA